MALFKKTAGAAEFNKTRTTEDLRNEYKLIDRERAAERAGGGVNVSGLATQGDIARELERRGE